MLGAAVAAGACVLLLIGNRAPPAPAPAPDAAGMPAAAPSVAGSSAEAVGIRAPVDASAAGIHVRIVAPASVREVAFAWATGAERTVRATPSPAPADDGWWSIDVPQRIAPAATDAANEASIALGVTARGCAVTWIRAPQPGGRYEITLEPLDRLLAVVDVETGNAVLGARVRLAAAPLAGEPWQPDALPGPDPERSIHLAFERSPGCYVVARDLPARPLEYEIQHAHWVVAPSAPPALLPDRGAAPLRILAQMPLVASVRYVGDEVLECAIGMGLECEHGPRAFAAAEAVAASLARRFDATRMVVVFPAIDPWRPEHLRAQRPAGARRLPSFATAKARFRHGARREDRVPLVRLADAVAPTALHVDWIGPAIELQTVTIRPPPKFGDVDATFRCMVYGVADRSIRMVTLGHTLELPPGDYLVDGAGGAMGVLERTTYTVRAGADTAFQLAWRKDLLMYTIQADVPVGVRMVQVLIGTGRQQGVADAPIVKDGVAVFWSKRTIDEGTACAKGCEPVPIVFFPTRDPRIRTGSCVLRPRPR